MPNPVNPTSLWGLSVSLHRRGLRRLARVVKVLNFVLFKASLPPECEMSETPHLMHYGLAVVVHPSTRFGSGVHLGHGVTVGASAPDVEGTVHPVVLGDDVWVGAGSLILARTSGPLHVGDGAVVAAGSVVVGDVAPGDRVAGNPARSIGAKRLKDAP